MEQLTRRAGVSILIIAAALCLGARAQEAAKAPPEETPLAGPKVPDRRTLVSTDMQGRFRRLEVRPEEAALDVLSIDAERLDLARGVVEQRASAIRKHVLENIELIKTFADGPKDGPSAEKLGRELYERFDPKHTRDPLIEPLARVLSSDEQSELKRVVEEYWERTIENEQARNRKQSRADIESRLAYEQFQREVRRAYDTTLRPFQQKLENIYAAVDPTPEQRRALRGVMIEYIRASQSSPGPERRVKLARAIYEALDEERRVKLLAAGIAAM